MAAPRILVTGAAGFLGGFAIAALRARGAEVLTTSRSAGDAAVDLATPGMIDAVVEALAPDRVLNLAALSRLADCERDPQRAERVNHRLPAQWAARFGPRLVHVSTDLVFDGRAAPYDAGASPSPLSAYGHSKAAGETAVLAAGGCVVRLPLLFGPDERGRGATAMLRAAFAAARRVELYTNEYRTPLHARDAAEALAEVALAERAPSLLHLAGPERCSRWSLGQRFCALHGFDGARLVPIECQDPLRPRDVSLRSPWPVRRSLDAMLRDA